MKDPRLQAQEFQAGYCVSYDWQTAVRFFFARARREAQLLSVPLSWIQASDDSKGVRRTAQTRARQRFESALRHWNIHDTAHPHTLLPACVGQRVRLTANISADHSLAQEAEGTGVHIVLDPDESLDAERGEAALQYCPVGIWACFDDCNVAPLANQRFGKIDSSAREALWRLNAFSPTSAREPDRKVKPVHERMAFVPAVTHTFSRMIAGKKWTIRRRMVPLTSAFDRTIQSSQGKPSAADLSATWETLIPIGMPSGRRCMYYSRVLLAWKICCCGVRRRAYSMRALRHN